jgi:hypothetical protein
MFLASGALPARKADNLTAVSGLSKQCGILDMSQPYRTPRPVIRIVSLLLLLYIIEDDIDVIKEKQRNFK